MNLKLATWLVLGTILLTLNDGVSGWRRRRRRSPAPCDSSGCEWKWSECNVTCGKGTKSAIETKKKGACGSCDMPLTPQLCDMGCCPKDCVWKDWRVIMPCTVTCGGGWEVRTRSKLVTEQCGGKCAGESFELSHCAASCCPEACVWGPWTHWGRCSHSCGHGVHTRSRYVERPEKCGGRRCHGSTNDEKICNIAECKSSI